VSVARWFLLAVVLAASAATRAARADEPDVAALFDRHRASVVHVEAGGTFATGVVFDAPARVLTTLWIANLGSLTVTGADGHKRRAKVVAWDAARDLALLDVEGAPGEPVSGAPSCLLGLGQAAVVIDGPRLWSQSAKAEVPAGPTARLARVAARDASGLRLQLRLNRGDAGAPVFSADGQLAALVTAGPYGPDLVTATCSDAFAGVLANAGRQGMFVPTSPVDRGRFASLFIVPFSTRRFLGAGLEAGYKYGWLAGAYRAGYLQNEYAPVTSTSDLRRTQSSPGVLGATTTRVVESHVKPLVNVVIVGPLFEVGTTIYLGANPEARVFLGLAWGRVATSQ